VQVHLPVRSAVLENIAQQVRLLVLSVLLDITRRRVRPLPVQLVQLELIVLLVLVCVHLAIVVLILPLLVHRLVVFVQLEPTLRHLAR